MNNKELYSELHGVHKKLADVCEVIFSLAVKIDKERTSEQESTGFKRNEYPLRYWTKVIHELAKEKGWWKEARPIPELLVLIHSEVSEALEEYRNDPPLASPFGFKLNASLSGKPEGFPIEPADIIIRILDLCGYYNIDIEEMIRVKHEYNKTREYRHGGKVI